MVYTKTLDATAGSTPDRSNPVGTSVLLSPATKIINLFYHLFTARQRPDFFRNQIKRPTSLLY